MTHSTVGMIYMIIYITCYLIKQDINITCYITTNTYMLRTTENMIYNSVILHIISLQQEVYNNIYMHVI